MDSKDIDAPMTGAQKAKSLGEPFYRSRHTVRYDLSWSMSGPLRVNAICTICRADAGATRKVDEDDATAEVRAMDRVKHVGNCGLLKAASIVRRRRF